MRKEPGLAERPSGRRPAVYPSPTDRHPSYLYGVFAPGVPAACPCGLADEAVLGIREQAGAVLPEIHRHRHADVQAGDAHTFMFGVAPEQSPIVSPDDPAYYFWDVGTA